MCLESLKKHDFILFSEYHIRIEIVSHDKKYAPKSGTRILSLYQSMTKKMEHKVHLVYKISKYAWGLKSIMILISYMKHDILFGAYSTRPCNCVEVKFMIYHAKDWDANIYFTSLIIVTSPCETSNIWSAPVPLA